MVLFNVCAVGAFVRAHATRIEAFSVVQLILESLIIMSFIYRLSGANGNYRTHSSDLAWQLA